MLVMLLKYIKIFFRPHRNIIYSSEQAEKYVGHVKRPVDDEKYVGHVKRPVDVEKGNKRKSNEKSKIS